jgi:glycosyltransferase involved in cell wall biosynthesis
LAKGLVELGHDVFYLLEGLKEKLPSGMQFVCEPTMEADIFHNINSAQKPWVQTCHRDPAIKNRQALFDQNHTIYVSKTLAQACNSDRYVLNGLDPADYIYSEAKDEYLLFICWLDWAHMKGLNLAISLAQKMGFPLIVAGGSSFPDQIKKIHQQCKSANVQFVGDVDGPEKARLYSQAKALLFPTQVKNEAFGLVMAEALLSGTPVICSNMGACPEIISDEVGFVCANNDDYIYAIENVGQILSKNCVQKAVNEFHYLAMAKNYVLEYERELAKVN